MKIYKKATVKNLERNAQKDRDFYAKLQVEALMPEQRKF